jgi:hypothetical protein
MKKVVRIISIAFTVVVALTLLVIVIFFVYGILNEGLLPTWLGTNKVIDANKIISPPKTLWDLVNLLLIPIVLTIGGYLFNQSQQKRDQEFAEAQNENQRRIGLDRDQEQALQNYLDKMSELLLEKKLGTTKDKVILNLARSRTLTILRSLNNQYLDIAGRGRNRRKGSLARFLYEMNLITGKKPIISLSRANLEFAYMNGDDFFQVNFKDAYLKEADLRNANLQEAILVNAYLPNARLKEANLIKADLTKANLTKANLQKANLIGATLDGAIFDGADLQDAIMPDGTVHV